MSIKKSIRILALALAIIIPGQLLSAEEVSITWKWEASQEGVTAFRYQLDGEQSDLWTVVDASTLTYESAPLDGEVNHVLYVQQSFDGILWGPSGSYTYDAASYKASLNQVEAPVVASVEPVEAVVATQGAPVQEAAQTVNRNAIELSAFAGGRASNYVLTSMFDSSNTYTDLNPMILPSVALDYIADQLVSFSPTFNLGLRIGLGYQMYWKSGLAGQVHFGDVHALMTLGKTFKNASTVELALGAGVAIPYANLTTAPITAFDPANINVFYGPVGSLSYRKMLNAQWSAGITGEVRMLLSGMFVPYELTGTVRASIARWF